MMMDEKGLSGDPICAVGHYIMFWIPGAAPGVGIFCVAPVWMDS